jgi:hypothetical protein
MKAWMIYVLIAVLLNGALLYIFSITDDEINDQSNNNNNATKE